MRFISYVLAVCAVTVAALFGAGAAPADAVSSGMFRAGVVWHGQFGTPSLIKVGRTYWAFATTTGGDNVPSAHSTDLRTWRTRSAYPAAHNPGWWAGYNDELPHPAKWALYYIHRNGRNFTSIWAPSVTRVGGRYVMAYAAAIGSPNRHCISIATSAAVDGPYVDTTSRPLVCSSDPNGSIDPQLLQPGDGKIYLVWKNAGVRGSKPTQVWSRPLNTRATGFAARSRQHFLLQTARPWEGNVIENPSMIHYGSRYFLFYSGNNFRTTAYGTGYATCAGPLGPCRRPKTYGPLLATNATTAGPGGASPIRGPRGGLRLAYAAWDTGHTTPNDPIRLHIASLAVHRSGALRVVGRG